MSAISPSPHTHRLWTTGSVLVAVAVVLASGTGSVEQSALQSAAQFNVVLLTLDTTRADRLTPYGYMNASMAAFDRLASEGVVFDQAVSVAPLTLPAHASIMTGLLPLHHGVRDNAAPPLGQGFTTLAEVLTADGYCSTAFVGSAVLDAERGLAQGFQQYGNAGRLHLPSSEVVDRAIGWLAAESRHRLFLWVHLYDPHWPYEPPEPYRSRHFDPYLGEIAFMDAQVGRLLDSLEGHGLLESTLVILAGDHGESLGDHGEATHGRTVYESVMRVPLIVRMPDRLGRARTAGLRVPELVRLVDVMPTVLDLLGIRHSGTDGVSLAHRIRGHLPRVDLAAYAESTYAAQFTGVPAASLRDDRYKLILGSTHELYDLETDPFEQRSLYDSNWRVAEAMMRALHDIQDGGLPSDWNSQASQELRERLGALGYLMSGPPTPAAAPGPGRIQKTRRIPK